MLQSCGWRVTLPCLTVIPSAPALPLPLLLRSSHHPSVSCCRASRSVDVKMIWGPSRSWKENHSMRSRHRWHSLLNICLRSSGVLVFDQTLFSLVTFHWSTFHERVQTASIWGCKKIDCNKLPSWDHLLCTHSSAARTYFSQRCIPLPWLCFKEANAPSMPQHSWNSVVKSGCSAAAKSKCSLL